MAEVLPLWNEFASAVSDFLQGREVVKVKGDLSASLLGKDPVGVEFGELILAGNERTVGFRCGNLDQERVLDYVGQGLTRAGFQRPLLDPEAMATLLELRAKPPQRVELICETSALSNGLAHYLVDLLHDCSDLLISPVSLREIQDNRAQKKWKGVTALVCWRLRELPPPAVLWRELPLEDVPLLLSRGNSAKGKVSESDTSILRSARRAIHEQIRGLRRLFVVTDTDLGRRAATELPSGSLVAGDSKYAVPGRVYLPTEWWPTTQSYRCHATGPAQLIWELLPMCEQLLIEDPAGGHLAFQGHRPGGKMWPSDYLRPWVAVDTSNWNPPRPPEDEPDATPTYADLPILQAQEVPDRSSNDTNFRISVTDFLNALCASANQPISDEHLASTVVNAEARRHLGVLFRALGFHAEDEDEQRRQALHDAVAANDLETVRRLLAPWSMFDRLASEQDPGGLAISARKSVNRIVEALGFRHRGELGGATPSTEAVRTALHAAADERGGTVTAHHFLVKVMLEDLHVSPARTHEAWSRMVDAGVFEEFELREGGTPEEEAQVASLSLEGWSMQPIPLDSLGGYRDFVRRSHE